MLSTRRALYERLYPLASHQSCHFDRARNLIITHVACLFFRCARHGKSGMKLYIERAHAEALGARCFARSISGRPDAQGIDPQLTRKEKSYASFFPMKGNRLGLPCSSLNGKMPA